MIVTKCVRKLMLVIMIELLIFIFLSVQANHPTPTLFFPSLPPILPHDSSKLDGMIYHCLVDEIEDNCASIENNRCVLTARNFFELINHIENSGCQPVCRGGAAVGMPDLTPCLLPDHNKILNLATRFGCKVRDLKLAINLNGDECLKVLIWIP